MSPDEIRHLADPFFRDFDLTSPVKLVPCQYDLDDGRIVHEVAHVPAVGIDAREAANLIAWAGHGMRIYSWHYEREPAGERTRLSVRMALPHLREELRAAVPNWRTEALLIGLLESIRGWRDAGIDAAKLVGLERSLRDDTVVPFFGSRKGRA